jgi:1-acyl-sn-glycerol-3-phosphate acyltransferase
MLIQEVLRNLLVWLYVMISVPVIGLLAILTRKKFWARLWCEWLLKVLGIRIVVLGNPLPPKGQRYVFMSNHQSQLDIPVLEALLKAYDIRFLAKKSLFKIPFFGWGISALGYIPVEREDPKEGLRSLLACVSALQSGVSLVIFPEGTRSRTGELLPFKKGGMLVPLKAEVPVCPLAIYGTKDILPKGSLWFHLNKREVYVYVGSLIETKGMTLRDKEKLSQMVREEISRGLEYCERGEKLWEKS